MTRRNVLLVVGLVLSAVVFASVFFPWLKMEYVPLDGYRIPELAKEQYGPTHWLAFATYLILSLPAVATVVFWQLVIAQRLRFPWWPLVVQFLVASVILAMLLYYSFDPALNLQMKLAAWMGWCGTVGLLVWQRVVRRQ